MWIIKLSDFNYLGSTLVSFPLCKNNHAVTIVFGKAKQTEFLIQTFNHNSPRRHIF